MYFRGTTDAFGNFSVELPIDAGTVENPPAIMTCYLALSLQNGSADPNGWYIPGAPTFCGVGGRPVLSAFLYRGSVKWPILIVVVY